MSRVCASAKLVRACMRAPASADKCGTILRIQRQELKVWAKSVGKTQQNHRGFLCHKTFYCSLTNETKLKLADETKLKLGSLRIEY